MMNIQGIMKQAQAMQKKMEEMQEKLAQEETEGVSGGGMVKVVLNGKFEMKKVTIDTSLVVADETDILEDLITAAYNDAKAKVDAKMQKRIGHDRRIESRRFKTSLLKAENHGRNRN